MFLQFKTDLSSRFLRSEVARRVSWSLVTSPAAPSSSSLSGEGLRTSWPAEFARG